VHGAQCHDNIQIINPTNEPATELQMIVCVRIDRVRRIEHTTPAIKINDGTPVVNRACDALKAGAYVSRTSFAPIPGLGAWAAVNVAML